MESTLIDYHQLEPFIVIGIADYLDLLNDVIRDVPSHLENIRIAIRDGNTREFKNLAHTFRGMISHFGCIAMTARLAQLEHYESIVPNQAAAIHAELQALWGQSLAALKDWEKSVPNFAT